MEAQVYLTVAFSSSAFFGLLFLIIIYNKYVFMYLMELIELTKLDQFYLMQS